MGREKNDAARRGEQAAALFLRRKRYEILGSNVRTPFGELDLVARHDGVMVFVETKTRTGDSLGPPSISVTWRKARSVVKNALFYLKSRGIPETPWRIDVVSVRLGPCLEVEHIELIENAVENNGY